MLRKKAKCSLKTWQMKVIMKNTWKIGCQSIQLANNFKILVQFFLGNNIYLENKSIQLYREMETRSFLKLEVKLSTMDLYMLVTTKLKWQWFTIRWVNIQPLLLKTQLDRILQAFTMLLSLLQPSNSSTMSKIEIQSNKILTLVRCNSRELCIKTTCAFIKSGMIDISILEKCVLLNRNL